MGACSLHAAVPWSNGKDAWLITRKRWFNSIRDYLDHNISWKRRHGHGRAQLSVTQPPSGSAGSTPARRTRVRPVRLAVRMRDPHSRGVGSTPLRVTETANNGLIFQQEDTAPAGRKSGFASRSVHCEREGSRIRVAGPHCLCVPSRGDEESKPSFCSHAAHDAANRVGVRLPCELPVRRVLHSTFQEAVSDRAGRTVREERLSHRWFFSLDEARAVPQAWMEDYNRGRPHSALGKRTPQGSTRRVDGNRRLPALSGSHTGWIRNVVSAVAHDGLGRSTPLAGNDSSLRTWSIGWTRFANLSGGGGNNTWRVHRRGGLPPIRQALSRSTTARRATSLPKEDRRMSFRAPDSAVSRLWPKPR